MIQTALPTRLTEVTAAATFVWKDFGRFVEVAPVQRGWLVLWGSFRDSGRTRELAGNQTYTDFEGARRRVSDAVLELTRDPALVAEAVMQLNRTRFPAHAPNPLPVPLGQSSSQS